MGRAGVWACAVILVGDLAGAVGIDLSLLSAFEGTLAMTRAAARLVLVAGILWPLVLTACGRPSVDTKGAAFFSGRTIDYIVATHAGGTYDTYGRLIAKYMARHLPGVRIVVRNVQGAANIVGANEIYAAAPDGLTMGTFTMGLMYSQLVGASGVRYDLGKMSWIGKAASEPRALVLSASSPYKDVEDLRHASKPLRMWTGPVGSPTYFSLPMLAEAVGFKVELVPGFEEDEGVLAILRGDVVGGLSSPASVAPMVEQRLVRIALQIGRGAELSAPVQEAGDVAVSPVAASMMAFARIQAELGRVTAAPPGVPADRLDALRQAYHDAVTDPALGDELRKVNFQLDPMDGDAVAKRVDAALNPSPEILAWLRARIAAGASR